MARPLRPAGADSRSRQARGDRRRQQILDAAVELFSSRGYRSTGILTLAERVGLSDTGLLYYFGSKERLLQEVVSERPQAPFEAPASELTLRQLRDLGRRYAGERTLTRLYLVLAAENLNDDDPLHDFFVQRYRRGVDFVKAVLEHDRHLGAIRPDVDTGQIAHEILATELGLELMWLMDPRIDIAAIRAHHIDHLVEDLAAPSGSSGSPAGEVDAIASTGPGRGSTAAPAPGERRGAQGPVVRSITPGSVSASDDRVILHIPSRGSTRGRGARRSASMIASRLGMRLWTVDCSDEPPVDLDDVVVAYRRLVGHAGADRVVVHGTSDGADLAVALALRAGEDGLRPPAAVVLVSPRLTGHSPVTGEATRDFPPTFVTGTTGDPLFPSTVRLHRWLRSSDVAADLYLVEGLPPERLLGPEPESLELYRQVRLFIDGHVPQRDATPRR